MSNRQLFDAKRGYAKRGYAKEDSRSERFRQALLTEAYADGLQ